MKGRRALAGRRRRARPWEGRKTEDQIPWGVGGPLRFRCETWMRIRRCETHGAGPTPQWHTDKVGGAGPAQAQTMPG